MRKYEFISRKDPSKRCVIVTSIVDANERFTVMQVQGVEGTEFERNVPWGNGSVASVGEVNEWYAKHALEYEGFIYSNKENEVIDMDVQLQLTKTLTVTPTITGGDTAVMVVKTMTTEGEVISEELQLTNGESATAFINVGYKYSFELKGGAEWSGTAPEDVVCEGDVNMTVGIAYIDYLTFTGKDTQNSVQLKWTPAGLNAPDINMEVSVNDAEWRPYEITSGTGEVITLADNDTVKFRGNNETLGNVPPGPGGYWQFVMTGVIEAHGNIMSLLDKTCKRLDVPTSAFYHLFQSCTSLTIAPELPATTLAANCYANMFNGCTSLTTAPALPATTLAGYCYEQMFLGCTSLTTAPQLPATTLADSCYAYMFQGCTSLTSLTIHANDISAQNCLGSWLNDTADSTTGTLCSLGSADFTGKIPNNWTISTTPPESDEQPAA